MRKPRFLVSLPFLTALLLLALPNVIFAKGPPQKISMTGPGIEGEFTSTRVEMISELGMATFEDFSAEVKDIPADLGDYYEITRYYYNGPDTFTAFDQIRYYPPQNHQKHGLIHYLGIVNGSSDYDNKWFNATQKGEEAFAELLLHVQAEPYLLLTTTNGYTELLNPITLETSGVLALGQVAPDYFTADLSGQNISFGGILENTAYAYNYSLLEQSICRVNIEPKPNTTQTHFFSEDGMWGAEIETSSDQISWLKITGSQSWGFIDQIELETSASGYRGAWQAHSGRLFFTDGFTLFEAIILNNMSVRVDLNKKLLAVDPELQKLLDSDENLLETPGIFDRKMLLHHPQASGIYVIDTKTAEQVAYWHPKIQFSRIISGDNGHLYALQNHATEDSTTVYVLDAVTGDVLASRDFADSVWQSAAYLRLAPKLIPPDKKAAQTVACPQAEVPLIKALTAKTTP